MASRQEKGAQTLVQLAAFQLSRLWPKMQTILYVPLPLYSPLAQLKGAELTAPFYSPCLNRSKGLGPIARQSEAPSKTDCSIPFSYATHVPFILLGEKCSAHCPLKSFGVEAFSWIHTLNVTITELVGSVGGGNKNSIFLIQYSNWFIFVINIIIFLHSAVVVADCHCGSNNDAKCYL